MSKSTHQKKILRNRLHDREAIDFIKVERHQSLSASIDIQNIEIN